MFKRLGRGLQHTATLLAALPAAPKRTLLGRMIAFSRILPQQFEQPLPQMMARLTSEESASQRVSESASQRVSESVSQRRVSRANLTTDEIRCLADAVAAWHLGSPLGICLRRSLLRYHFLREAGLPVSIVFGARLKNEGEGGGVGGHAWLTLNGSPYYENPADYTGFAQMYVYPVDGRQGINVEAPDWPSANPKSKI